MTPAYAIPFARPRPAPGASLSLRIRNAGDLAALAIPAFSWCEIHVIGRLFLPDLLLLCCIPFLWGRIQAAFKAKAVAALTILGALWFANQVATDLYRGTPFDDLARGWSKIGLFVLNLSIVSALVDGRNTRMLLYGLGCAIGYLTATQLNPDPWFWADHWKFGYSQPFNLALATAGSFAWARAHRKLAVVLLCIPAGVNGILGARGAAAAVAVAAMLLVLDSRAGKGRSFASRLRTMAVVAVMTIAGANAYVAVAAAGWLGEELRAKVAAEGSGDLGVVVGGRNLLLAGVERITESPFIGMGSWATGSDYLASAASVLRDHGYTITSDTVRQADPHALSHSHVIGAWVEAGLFGGIFWAVTFIIITVRLLTGRWRQTPLSPLILYLGCMLLWEILFSPFAQERRFITPFYICCVLAATPAVRRRVGPNDALHTRQAMPIDPRPRSRRHFVQG